MAKDHDTSSDGKRSGRANRRKKQRERKRAGTANTSSTNTRAGDVTGNWVCKTEELKHDTFYWGDGMNDRYSSSRQHFLQYVGKSFSGNEKKSIENGYYTILGIEEPPLVQNEADFDNLDFLMKRRYNDVCKEFAKAKATLIKNLSTLYDNLLEACEPTLVEKIKRHADFTFDQADGVPCAMRLMLIIQDLCSSTAGINYVPEMAMTVLYDLLLIDGNKMTLQKYVELFKERYEACKRMGYVFGTVPVQQGIIAQSLTRYGRFSTTHVALTQNVADRAEEMVITQIFFRRSGNKYEELRDKFKNDYRIENWNNFPTTIAEMSNLLENYKPMAAEITRNIVNQIKKENTSRRRPVPKPDDDDDGDDEVKPDKTTSQSGNTDETGKSFLQDGKTGNGDPKDFRKGHNTASVPGREQSQRPSAVKDGQNNRDTHNSQECATGNPNNNNKNNKQTHSSDKSGIKCYACGEFGHYATDKECPLYGKKTTKATTFLLTDYDDEYDGDDYDHQFVIYGSLSQELTVDFRTNTGHILNNNNRKGRLPALWMLLDNQSTVNVFWNIMFLVNVRKTTRRLNLHTNVGQAIINEVGELPGFGTVWVHRKGIANILSLDAVADTPGYNIDYTTRSGNRDFVVETANGSLKRFVGNGRGLHYLDCSSYFGPGKTGCVFGDEIHNTEKRLTWRKNPEGTTFLIETVDGNKLQFSNRDVQRADELRRFEEVAAFPSRDTMRRAINKNVIKDSPHTLRDLNITHRIHGRSRHAIQGKRTRRRNTEVEVIENIPVPRSLREYYSAITLCADVMFINKNPVLITVSRHLHYSTATMLRSTKLNDLETALNEVIKEYHYREFQVKHLLIDKQFEGLSNRFTGVQLNSVSRDEHVPEVERLIRTIKERCRCFFSIIPFAKIPHRMAIELVYTCVFYINAFPWISGPEKTLSPFTIVQGRHLHYHKHFQVRYGQYAQIFEGSDNTMKPRCVGAIALGPTGNAQGGVRFFSLSSGRVVDRRQNDYDLLPLPADAIVRVEKMARRSPIGLLFGNRNNILEEDSDDEQTDPTYEPSDHSDDDSSSSTSTTNDNSDTDSIITGVNNENDDDEDNDDDSDHNNDEEDPPPRNENNDNNDNEDRNVNNTDNNNNTRTRSGRPIRKNQDTDRYEYQHLHVDGDHEFEPLTTENEYNNYIDTVDFLDGKDAPDHPDMINVWILLQYNLSQGLRKYGDAGKTATMKELNQLVIRDVFEETNYNLLTEQEKKEALPILLFLTMKRDGETVKGRACADGRKQRLWTKKEDVSSPTIAFEALLYTLMIDAMEGRDVATIDLPGHFLQTDMDEKLILKIQGALAMLLVEMNPSRWKKHLRHERGRPVIYVKCMKAIYGTINAAILAYKKLVGFLEEWGFEQNFYEPCCWNAMIEGKQCTIVFHVDDLKLSHMCPIVVSNIIKKFDKAYATIDKLTIRRGKVHEYLGMTIDFRSIGEVKLNMYDMIQKLINDLPDDMIGKKNTAAPSYLFDTSNDDECPRLNKERKDTFHTINARALYISRVRQDMKLCIGFGCTRVKQPNEYDWTKLGWGMKYLQHTKFLPLILRTDGKSVSIYLDGAHASHSDMKGHSGEFVTEGKGAVFSSSTKQKLNTLSSTETEIVTVGEKLPKNIWYRYFRIEQGGSSKEDVILQDNQSAMLIENHGRMSCRKGSKHIHIRYFFVTDRIKHKEVRIEYCPTGEMIADFMTKPLQGSIFIKFRNLILGIREEDFESYKLDFEQILLKYGLTERSIGNGDSSSTKTELNATEPLNTSFVKPQECVGELPRVRTSYVKHARE